MDSYVNHFISIFDINLSLIKSRREECDKRGYHTIGREPKEEDLSSICLDCELFFNPNDPNNTYRVLPQQSS